MVTVARRKVLITGAAGGMGRACARLFGATDDLVLTDVTAASLDAFADDLRRDGFTVVAAIAGDMLDAGHLARLAGELAGGAPFAVVHTAGLSPALAGWEAIMKVNLVASELLMDALEPVLSPGTVVVPISSMAGHLFPAMPELDALLANPLDAGFMAGIGGAIDAMLGGHDEAKGGVSYSLSKRGVHLLTSRRAIAWGPRGVRVASISPGVIHTPMGLKENETTPGALDTMKAAPLGRIGTAMEIAMAARFLCGEEAGYITGTDLRVDGGSTAALLAPKG